MRLRTISYAESSGELRQLYDRMLSRPLPSTYRPTHGGVSGIMQAHSADPRLLERVFVVAPTLLSSGPLETVERELVAALTSRLNQCFYCTACHTEFLRHALGGERDVPLAVVTSPYSLRYASPKLRMIAELTTLVTEAPWQLSAAHRERAHAVGVDDDAILQTILISAFTGHHNRIADAVGIGLDYDVEIKPPVADPSVPPLTPAASQIAGRAAIDIARRTAATALFAGWRSYVFDRDAPLSRRQRTITARWVAAWLGDASISAPDELTINPHDDNLRAVAQVITLSTWQINDATFTTLRTSGFDDAAVFDLCSVASTTGMFSRITVALAALGR